MTRAPRPSGEYRPADGPRDQKAEAGALAAPSDAERAELRARLDRVLGQPSAPLVVVLGQAGVGKTRLLDDVAATWRARGARVLRASAEAGGDVQFQMWRRPAFELGVDLPDTDTSLGQAEQSWELTELLRDALVGIAPVLVVLDDLHWADTTSLGVLRHLAADLVGSDVTLLGASREVDSTDHGEVLRRAECVRVPPLTRGQTAQLAERLTGEPMAAEELDALHRRTGGVPLLMVEVLHGDAGPGAAAADVLGDSLRRAGDEVQHTLSVLSLGGPNLPVTVLADACGVSVSVAQRHLDLAIDAEVLVLDDADPRFRHDLLAEAAAGRLDAEQRRRAHRALADGWARADEPGRRARHLVEALPTCATIDEVVVACGAAATSLRRARRSADAVQLLTRASSVCRMAGASGNALARLALASGEAQWEAGDLAAALDTFAAGASIEPDDVELAARLEVARHRRHDVHAADPEGRERLQRFDAALDPADSTLRVELLGRLGALAQQPPFDTGLAEDVTTRAVAIARRLGDADALAQALHDRFLWITTADHHRERDAHAEEMIAVSRRAARPDLGLVGLQWRLDAELNRHDTTAARRTVDEALVLADLSRSSDWRIRVLVQRALLVGLGGNRDDAFALVGHIDETAATITPPLRPYDRSAHVMFVRNALCLLYGTVDAGLGEMRDREVWVDQVRMLAVQVMAASVELAAGRFDTARTRAMPWLAEPERHIESPAPLLTLCQLARFAVLLERDDLAPAVLEQLLPYAGRLVLAEQIELVDHLLAGLIRLVGDHPRAIAHAQAAREAARALGSPPLEAVSLAELACARLSSGDSTGGASVRSAARRLADRCGVHLDGLVPAGEPAADPVVPPQALVTVLRDHRTWTVSHRGRSFELRATAGLDQLARLLVRPGEEIAATELAGFDAADAPPVAHDLGPALDARAKREYRRRLLDLQEEMDDSARAADAERSARTRIEYEALLDELRAATGLGGRDRPQHSGRERARVNVTRSVRRAVGAIAARSDELGRHLEVSVRTGSWCSYEPDPTTPLRWTVRDRRDRDRRNTVPPATEHEDGTPEG